jgi:hypothetical protein
MIALRIIMPGTSDMEVVNQAGGSIDLQPFFYGNEAMGPVVQVVDLDDRDKAKVKTVLGRYRLKIKPNGKISLAQGCTAEEASGEDADPVPATKPDRKS